MPAVLVDAVSQDAQELKPFSERACLRCGRPNERSLKAKYCSDTCRVRACEERHKTHDVAPEGPGSARSTNESKAALESLGTVTVTVPTGTWERSSGKADGAQETPHSNGNGAGTIEAAAAVLRQALQRRLRVGAKDAILRRVQSFMTRASR